MNNHDIIYLLELSQAQITKKLMKLLFKQEEINTPILVLEDEKQRPVRYGPELKGRGGKRRRW